MPDHDRTLRQPASPPALPSGTGGQTSNAHGSQAGLLQELVNGRESHPTPDGQDSQDSLQHNNASRAEEDGDQHVPSAANDGAHNEQSPNNDLAGRVWDGYLRSPHQGSASSDSTQAATVADVHHRIQGLDTYVQEEFHDGHGPLSTDDTPLRRNSDEEVAHANQGHVTGSAYIYPPSIVFDPDEDDNGSKSAGRD